jgi:hypothetical protein
LNLEVFCYVGLLRFPEQLKASLPLLPEAQRAEADAFLATVKDLPRTELLRKWSRLRENQCAAIRRVALERTGIRLDELPPSIREGCVTWLLDQNE